MKTVTLRARQGTTRSRARAPRQKALQIRRALVPIDFSKPSWRALEFALPLLREFGAQLHLAHVIEPVSHLSSLAALPIVVARAQVAARVRSHLKAAARQHGIELPRENMHLLRGSPFEEICRLAQDEKIDLIVTATRGNTGLKHLLLGSMAERIVRYAPCPVLVVRGGDLKKSTGQKGQSPRARQIKRILVPIDFSNCSMKGLTYAKGLAGKFDATLVLLHSVYVRYYGANDEYSRYDLPLLTDETEKASRKQMRRLVEETDWEELKVEALLRPGHPGDQICAQAKQQRADLIVTSTHGTTGLRHILLGSTAEYVVRHAPTSVLVVPSHKRPALLSTRK